MAQLRSLDAKIVNVPNHELCRATRGNCAENAAFDHGGRRGRNFGQAPAFPYQGQDASAVRGALRGSGPELGGELRVPNEKVRRATVGLLGTDDVRLTGDAVKAGGLLPRTCRFRGEERVRIPAKDSDRRPRRGKRQRRQAAAGTLEMRGATPTVCRELPCRPPQVPGRWQVCRCQTTQQEERSIQV